VSLAEIPPIPPLVLTTDSELASSADIIEHVLADPARRTEELVTRDVDLANVRFR
jgi:hypothetical protein